MHELNGTYAQRFNGRHGRRGHVFGARFSSWVIEDDDHFEATLAYVVGNPVRAGLVLSPDEWRWGGLGAPPPEDRPGPVPGSWPERTGGGLTAEPERRLIESRGWMRKAR